MFRNSSLNNSLENENASTYCIYILRNVELIKSILKFNKYIKTKECFIKALHNNR
jgi:hypothetical protein